MDKFYMVYVDGRTGSTFKHPTPEDAEVEAERLAGLLGNRDRNVIILEAMSYCHLTPSPVEWHKII